MMIFSLVAMTGLEKCCITSAYLPWLCHSGERPVARGPLVYFWSYLPLYLNLILCPLYYLNNFHNILMILGRIVDRTSQNVAYKNDNSGDVVGDICFFFLKNLFLFAFIFSSLLCEEVKIFAFFFFF